MPSMSGQDFFGLEQAGLILHRQIHLGGVTGDHRPGIETDPGEKHFHLFPGGVLGLIEDDKGIAQCPAAHEGEGGNLDYLLFDEITGLFRAEHVI